VQKNDPPEIRMSVPELRIVANAAAIQSSAPSVNTTDAPNKYPSSIGNHILKMVCDALSTIVIPKIVTTTIDQGADESARKRRLISGIRHARWRSIGCGCALIRSSDHEGRSMTLVEERVTFHNTLVRGISKLDELSGTFCVTPTRGGVELLQQWRDVVSMVVEDLSASPQHRSSQRSSGSAIKRYEVSADDLVTALVHYIISSSITPESLVALLWNLREAVRLEKLAKSCTDAMFHLICDDGFFIPLKAESNLLLCSTAICDDDDEEDYLVVTLEVCLEFVALSCLGS
jgi:hypothetical protein